MKNRIKNYFNNKIKISNFKSSLVLFSSLFVIVGGVFFANSKSEGQVFGWIQSNWSGNADAGATANAGDNPSNWTKFFSKDSNVTVSDSEVQISGTLKPFNDTTDSNFNTGTTKSNVYTNGSGAGAKVTLLKLDGASCTTATECAINSCVNAGASSVCLLPCSGIDLSTCGQSCVYNSDIYKTVKINTTPAQCWFAENLRTDKKPTGEDIVSGVFCDPAGCESPWGKFYSFAAALNGLASASVTGAKIQGLCPVNWHIPSDFNASASDDFQKLINFLGGNAVAAGSLKMTGTTYWNAPNTGATDNVGFSAVGSGYRYGPDYYARGIRLELITSQMSAYGGPITRNFWNDEAVVYRGEYNTAVAFSIRCVRD